MHATPFHPHYAAAHRNYGICIFICFHLVMFDACLVPRCHAIVWRLKKLLYFWAESKMAEGGGNVESLTVALLNIQHLVRSMIQLFLLLIVMLS